MIVLWIVLGRNWSVELFGYFNYFFAYISIVGIFFDFGMDVLLIKLLSSDKKHTIPAHCWKLKKIILLVVILFASLIGYLLNFPLGSLCFFIMGIILLSFSSFFNAIFRARDVLHIEAKIGLLQKIIFIGGSLIAIIYYKMGILSIAGIYFISHFLAFLLTLIILYKNNWLLVRKTNLSVKNYWQQSWPLFVTALLAILALRLDIFLLQWLTNPEQVGYYTAAMRLFEGATIISSAFIAVVFPKFVAKRKNATELLAFYRYTQGILSIIGLSIIIPGLLIASTAILLLYGDKFSPSIIFLETLLPLLLLVFLTTLSGNLLIAIGKQKQYMLILATMLVFQVVVNIISINIWGTMGAVMGYWLRELILFAFLWGYVKTVMKPNFLKK